MESHGAIDRSSAARLALAAGVGILALKSAAWIATGSVAILSDALESVVNVVAALFLVVILRIALRPADRNHPYGHGKVEYFAAGVEGALIAIAALVIAFEAIRAWQRDAVIGDLDLGLLLVVGASILNAGVGGYLLRAGRRSGSLALEADGRHLLSDVVTSAGVVIGLVAVWWTGIGWLDSLVALGVAVHILWVGGHLVRRAVGGLMDEADPTLLSQIARGLEARRRPWWIDIHSLRASRAGPSLSADLHLVVPRFFDADRLHEIGEELEDAVQASSDHPGEVIVHFDPCRPDYCAECVMSDCALRSTAPVERRPFCLEGVTQNGVDLERQLGWAAPRVERS